MNINPAEVQAEEEEAMVTALRNTFMPRLGVRDCSILAGLLRDLWPGVDINLALVSTGSVVFCLRITGGFI